MAKGANSNTTGSQLEVAVKTVLAGKSFELVNYRVWDKNREKYGDELLLENVPFTTVYEHKGNTEFLLISKKYDLQIRIECKWQQTAGSVDEKLPYLYLNAIEAMPETGVFRNRGCDTPSKCMDQARNYFRSPDHDKGQRRR